jgi:UMF1 family MFS transporter
MTDHADTGGGLTPSTGAALSRNLGSGLDPALDAMADAVAVTARKDSAKLNLGAASWSLYEGARDPYVIIVTIYVFGPYFATVVVGNAVKGQTLVANIAMIYGLCVAFTGPLLGASIDKIGRRKPLLLLMTALMVPLLCALWWVKPAGGLGLGISSLVLGLLGLFFAYSELLHNSMLTRAATPKQAPFASGLALSLGNFFSVFMLVFVLWAFALPGKVDWSFIPKHPLFGLDPLKHETDRIVGPLVAAVLVVLSIPLFLFTPDAPPTGVGLFKALSQGFEGLKATLRTLKSHRSAAIFLGSRMLYTDGMTAILVFTGVYAAGVMHWHTLELLAFGILLSIFAVAGGQVGAVLDATVGPKRSVQIEILGAATCLLSQLGMGPNTIFYMPYDTAAHAVLWHGPLFRTLPEAIYLMIGCCSAVFVCAQYASSRTFLTRLAPPGQSASFFGLYALSGTVTVWLGSALVRIFTGVFKSQQAGFAPIAMLLVIGFIGMLFVKHDGREASFEGVG